MPNLNVPPTRLITSANKNILRAPTNLNISVRNDFQLSTFKIAENPVRLRIRARVLGADLIPLKKRRRHMDTYIPYLVRE